jgi:hypothetical protein
MEFSDFYKFDTKFVKGPFVIKNDDLSFDELNLLSRGDYDGFQFPITFKVISGTKWLPVLAPPSVGLYVLKKDLINQFKKHQINGFKCFPILIEETDGKINEDYYGFSIVGKCGRIDFTKSKIIQKLSNLGITKIYKGLFPDMTTWNQSDVFRPSGSLFVILNKKVKNIFDEFDRSNLDFTPLDEVESLGIVVDNSI